MKSIPSPPKRRISAKERFEAVLSSATLEHAHELLSGMHILVDLFDKPDRWVSAIVQLRDAQAISTDESVFFLDLFLDNLVGEANETDPQLLDVANQLRSLEASHGVGEDEPWPFDPPPEFSELNERWQRRADQIVVDYLRSQAANEAADLLERSRDDYEASETRGRAEFDRRWPPGGPTAAERSAKARREFAAVKELMAVLALPSYESANERLKLIEAGLVDRQSHERWAFATLALRDSRLLSSDEAMYFLGIFAKAGLDKVSEVEARLVETLRAIGETKLAERIQRDRKGYWESALEGIEAFSARWSKSDGGP
jgi:hypothetical protein